MNTSRRSFLVGLFGASVSLATGCGGGTSSASGAGQAPPIVPEGNGPATVLGGVTARGTVDVGQFGGGTLHVLSILQPGSPVTEGGFQTQISQDSPHVLALVDDGGRLRGLALSRPGLPLLFDANSTALSMVLISPGLFTGEPQTLEERIALLTGLAPFAALVSALSGQLAAMDLPAALRQPDVADGMEASIEALLDVLETSNRTEEEKLERNGKLVVSRDLDSKPPPLKLNIANQGFRYVALMREVSDPAGQKKLSLPKLEGAVPTADGNVLPGLTALSLGSKLTGTSGQAGNGKDTVEVTGGFLSEVLYYVKGLGNPLHPENEEFPSRIGSEEFSQMADLLTFVYYVAFPLLEPFMNGLKAAPDTRQLAEDLARSVEVVTAAGNAFSVKLASLADLASTDGVKGLASALIDLLAPFLAAAANRIAASFAAAALPSIQAVGDATLAASQAASRILFSEGAATLVLRSGLVVELIALASSAASAAFTASLGAAATPELTAAAIAVGAAAVAVLVFLTMVTAAAIAVNCTSVATGIVGTPRTNIIRVSVPGKFLKLIGTRSEIDVVGLSENGSLLVYRADGTYLEPLGEDPIKLDDAQVTSFVNAREQVWYYRHSDATARLRFPDGNTFIVENVDGRPLTRVIALSDHGHIYGAFRLPDGNEEMFSWTSEQRVRPIGAFQQLGFLPTIVGTGDQVLYGNGGARVISGGPLDGFSERVTVKGSFGGRWELIPHRLGDPPFNTRYVDVNPLDEVLVLKETSRFPPGYTLEDLRNQLPQPGPSTTTQEISIESPYGNRTLFRTTSDTVEAVALNRNGEVAGVLNGVPTLWSAQGSRQDLRALFPPGADLSGDWRPLSMKGQFILLERNPGGELYLFHRGEA